jgi:CheY-like chemotaxis protein
MKVLVFDDNQTHRDAAKAQLKDHDLTVVGTYDEAQRLLTPESKFDVVLTDLLVPASKKVLGPEGLEFAGQEMPVGIFIGLLAAVKARAKLIAVFTDSSHHDHPASACFDAFEGAAFTVEGCKVLLCNNSSWVRNYDPADLGNELKFAEWTKRDDTVRAKNWAALLDYLLKQ